MNKIALNLTLICAIAIGGAFALQPQPALAQSSCSGTVCTDCFSEDCEEVENPDDDDTYCGGMESSSGAMLFCYKPGPEDEQFPRGG